MDLQPFTSNYSRDMMLTRSLGMKNTSKSAVLLPLVHQNITFPLPRIMTREPSLKRTELCTVSSIVLKASHVPTI